MLSYRHDGEKGRNIMKSTFIVYYLSWSPKSGECAYTRMFDSDEERANFRARIAYDAKSVHTWENIYEKKER